jgi:predicted ABC-type exoprotein transport system permease subunit
MLGMLIAWGVLTVVFVILLIYRSTLTMHEDDQLFLNPSEAHMQREQTELMEKVEKINPYVMWLGAASGVLILAIGGLAAYERLTQVQ